MEKSEKNKNNANETPNDNNQGDQSDGNAQPPNDSFDLSKLRLPQNFSDSINAKKALITVPVRKPDRQRFIRVRDGENWQFQTFILELKEDRDIYLVDDRLWRDLLEEIIPVILFTAITRQGDVFIWHVRLQRKDGNVNTWNESAFAAAIEAIKKWVRVTANTSIGRYEVIPAPEFAEIPEPEWPEVSGIEDLLKIAFKGKFIKSMDHTVLRKLRGEI